MRKRISCLVIAAMLLCLSACASAADKGTDLLKEGKYTEAQAKFEESIEKGKNLAESYRGLGISYWEQEKYQEALEAFEQALNEGTTETAVLYNLAGICAMQTEQYERAVFYFEEGQKFSDASEELLQEMAFNLVVSYEQLGEYQLAKEKLEEYLSKYPEDEKALKEQEFLETQS